MDVVLAGRNFDLGYKSDTARDQLPVAAAYRMVDWIPQLDAPVQRRGGWTYSTRDLNVQSACNHLIAVGWAPFQGDPHLVCVADNGKVFYDKLQNTFGGTYVNTTSFSSITHRLVWHMDLPGLVILSGGVAPAAPQKYISPSFGNYSVTPLLGSPPNASVGAAYGDWLLLANGTVGGVRYANRIWASAVGQPESWNTSNDFFDLPEEIVRIVPLRSMVLVFGYRQVWMLTGDTPPPGGNWTKYDLYAGGAMDGRSVVSYRDTVIFANNSGVFQTDGSSLVNLSELGGVSQRWRALVDTFNFSTGWTAAAGMFQGRYVIVVHDNNGNFVTCQVCEVSSRTWYEFSNLRALMFTERQSGPGTASADGHEELFFAHATKPRAGLAASIWGQPYGLPSADADATPVKPMLETPFYKLQSPGLKQIRNVWITHDVRAITNSTYALMKSTFATYAAAKAAVPNYAVLKQYWDSGLSPPALQIDAILTPKGSYSPLGSLAATQQERRRPVWIRKRAIGVGLRLTQTQASDDTDLAEIEFEARPLTRVRRG